MNTTDKLGMRETFRRIIDGSIEEFIDDTITEVNMEYCLANCPQLKHVELPNLVTISPTSYLFSGSFNLEYLDFRSLERTEAAGLLSNKTKLTYVNLDSLIETRSSFFMYDTSLTDISLPSLTIIGVSTFEGCTSLQNINIPNVTIIEENAFKDVPVNAIEQINFDNITYIGNIFNYYRKKVWKLKKVNELGQFAFGGNYSITKAVDFHNLTYMHDYALISGAVSTWKAFIIRTPSVCEWNATDSSYFIPSTCKIYVPANLVDAYKNSSYAWRNFTDNIFPIEGSPFEDTDWNEEVLDTL